MFSRIFKSKSSDHIKYLKYDYQFVALYSYRNEGEKEFTLNKEKIILNYGPYKEIVEYLFKILQDYKSKTKFTDITSGKITYFDRLWKRMECDLLKILEKEHKEIYLVKTNFLILKKDKVKLLL
jgi:hypothetical protein